MSDYATGLRLALKRAGKSQAWLAAQLGVTTPAVNQWVKGKSPVPQARHDAIETLLGWQPEDAGDVEDLYALYRKVRTPMAFLLSETPPDAIVSERYRKFLVIGTQEHAEWALGLWARYLEVGEDFLLAVAQRRKYLTKEQLTKVLDTGIQLTQLGEHLGKQLTEEEQVALWLRRAAPFASFSDLAERLVYADLEAQAVVPASPAGKGIRIAEEYLGREGYADWTPADSIYRQWRLRKDGAE